MVAVDLTGTREGNNTRTDSRAAPATLRLHLDVSIPRQAQDRYVAKNAFASATEATRRCCLAAIEEPGAHMKLERLATPRGISPDRSPQGRPTLPYTAIKDGDVSLRPSWGRPLQHLPRVLRRPRESYGLTHARYFLPKRLDGAHEAIRAYFALYGSGDPTVCCLPTATRPANVLAFVPAMGNQGWQATCTNVEIDGPTISDWLPVEMAPKEGGFRH
jgi:hypothetical protein